MEPLRLYHSRTTALVTAFGGCLVAGLSVASITSGDERNAWPFVMGAVGAVGGIIGFGRLFTRKPVIVVDESGIQVEQGIVEWDAIYSTATSYTGLPVRLKLHLTLQSGNRVDIDLQDLSRPARRALDEIDQWLRMKRPDLEETAQG